MQDLPSECFGALCLHHDALSQHLDAVTPGPKSAINLILHAKLYIFANTWIIESLEALCLHKLFRDLRTFRITKDTIGELLKPLSYTYDNTSGDADKCDGIGAGLRYMVIVYAGCKAKRVDRS